MNEKSRVGYIEQMIRLQHDSKRKVFDLVRVPVAQVEKKRTKKGESSHYYIYPKVVEKDGMFFINTGIRKEIFPGDAYKGCLIYRMVPGVSIK